MMLPAIPLLVNCYDRMQVFRVEMGILFTLTFNLYNEIFFASYMPSGWYKTLWRFMSNLFYKLEIIKNYNDLPILRKKDVYLMQAFVNGGFRKVDLKSLYFIRKFIQAVNLADIANADSNRISH